MAHNVKNCCCTTEHDIWITHVEQTSCLSSQEATFGMIVMTGKVHQKLFHV